MTTTKIGELRTYHETLNVEKNPDSKSNALVTYRLNLMVNFCLMG
jgi:hypothetical protein